MINESSVNSITKGSLNLSSSPYVPNILGKKRWNKFKHILSATNFVNKNRVMLNQSDWALEVLCQIGLCLCEDQDHLNFYGSHDFHGYSSFSTTHNLLFNVTTKKFNTFTTTIEPKETIKNPSKNDILIQNEKTYSDVPTIDVKKTEHYENIPDHTDNINVLDNENTNNIIINNINIDSSNVDSNNSNDNNKVEYNIIEQQSKKKHKIRPSNITIMDSNTTLISESTTDELYVLPKFEPEMDYNFIHTPCLKVSRSFSSESMHSEEPFIFNFNSISNKSEDKILLEETFNSNESVQKTLSPIVEITKDAMGLKSSINMTNIDQSILIEMNKKNKYFY